MHRGRSARLPRILPCKLKSLPHGIHDRLGIHEGSQYGLHLSEGAIQSALPPHGQSHSAQNLDRRVINNPAINDDTIMSIKNKDSFIGRLPCQEKHSLHDESPVACSSGFKASVPVFFKCSSTCAKARLGVYHDHKPPAEMH